MLTKQIDILLGRLAILLITLAVSGCSSYEKKIQYPFFSVKDIKGQADDCNSLDRYLQQVDSIRWSMRKDGIELETKFQHMVQLSLATAGAIAVAPAAYYTATPELVAMPYSIAYTNSDKLKNADVLLIALLSKRRDLGCGPHPRCAVSGDPSGTLLKLRDTRNRVESRETSEREGIAELTRLLDNMCPEG